MRKKTRKQSFPLEETVKCTLLSPRCRADHKRLKLVDELVYALISVAAIQSMPQNINSSISLTCCWLRKCLRVVAITFIFRCITVTSLFLDHTHNFYWIIRRKHRHWHRPIELFKLLKFREQFISSSSLWLCCLPLILQN